MLKKFRMEQSASSAGMVEDDSDGEWVNADQAEAVINELKSVLRLVSDTLPYIGGNEQKMERLIREIKSVL